MQKITRVNYAANTSADTALTTVVAAVDRCADFTHYHTFGPKLREFLREAPLDISCEEVSKVLALFSGWGKAASETMAIQMYTEEIEVWRAAYREQLLAEAAEQAAWATHDRRMLEMVRT